MKNNDLQEIREGLARLLTRVQAMEDHCKELSDMLLCRMDYVNDVEENEWDRQARQWEQEERDQDELEGQFALLLGDADRIKTSTNQKGWTHV